MPYCPQCLKAHEEDPKIIAARNVTCTCGWEGRSTEMIVNMLPYAQGDPIHKVVSELRIFIAQQVGTQLAKKLHELGLIPSPTNPELVALSARVLRAGAHGYVKGVLDQLSSESWKLERPDN